jgi:hypothetical protein
MLGWHLIGQHALHAKAAARVASHQGGAARSTLPGGFFLTEIQLPLGPGPTVAFQATVCQNRGYIPVEIKGFVFTLGLANNLSLRPQKQ